jgi:hypothetical protein
MIPAGYEPTIPPRERQQTYALGRAATGIGPFAVYASFPFLPASIQYFILNLLTASIQYFILNLLTAYFFIFFAIISPHFYHTFFLILYHNYFLLRLLTSFCPPSGTLHWRHSRTRIFASCIVGYEIFYIHDNPYSAEFWSHGSSFCEGTDKGPHAWGYILDKRDACIPYS